MMHGQNHIKDVFNSSFYLLVVLLQVICMEEK